MSKLRAAGVAGSLIGLVVAGVTTVGDASPRQTAVFAAVKAVVVVALVAVVATAIED